MFAVAHRVCRSRGGGLERRKHQSTASLLLQNDMSVRQRVKALIKRAQETSNRIAALVVVYMAQVCLVRIILDVWSAPY